MFVQRLKRERRKITLYKTKQKKHQEASELILLRNKERNKKISQKTFKIQISHYNKLQ